MGLFVFWHNENASWGVDGPFSEEEVSERLSSEYYGELPIFKDVNDVHAEQTGIVIIRGEVVVPKKKETVTRYTFEGKYD